MSARDANFISISLFTTNDTSTFYSSVVMELQVDLWLETTLIIQGATTAIPPFKPACLPGLHSTGSLSMSTPCWLFQLVFNSLFYNLFASTQIWMLSSSECRTIHVSDLGAYRCWHSSPLHWPHYLHGCRQSTKRRMLLVGQQSHCTMAFGVVALWQSYDSNRFRSCAIRISRSPQRTSFTK